MTESAFQGFPGLLAAVMIACLTSTFIMADEALKEPGMLERIMHPDRTSKSMYEGKTYNAGAGFADRTVATREYAGSKAFDAKSFGTKAFESARKSWIGSTLFPEKKLPENLQVASGDAGKRFASKELPNKSYSDPNKKSPFSAQNAYQTKEIALKGKTQGAIDNDPHLQEAVKKGLTVDDVRKLLNKAP